MPPKPFLKILQDYGTSIVLYLQLISGVVEWKMLTFSLGGYTKQFEAKA